MQKKFKECENNHLGGRQAGGWVVQFDVEKQANKFLSSWCHTDVRTCRAGSTTLQEKIQISWIETRISEGLQFSGTFYLLSISDTSLSNLGVLWHYGIGMSEVLKCEQYCWTSTFPGQMCQNLFFRLVSASLWQKSYFPSSNSVSRDLQYWCIGS